MEKYKMEIVFYKSKPLIILTFDKDTELYVDTAWKRKFKKLDNKTYSVATVIVEDVFEKNEKILGKWNDAVFTDNGVKVFYGFTKIKGSEVHALELTKRFVTDWMQEYTKLMKYTVNRDGKKPPISANCLYDASIYGDGTVGDITWDEYNALKHIINPDGEIITNMKKKLLQK